jgi:hypothetical protein
MRSDDIRLHALVPYDTEECDQFHTSTALPWLRSVNSQVKVCVDRRGGQDVMTEGHLDITLPGTETWMSVPSPVTILRYSAPYAGILITHQCSSEVKLFPPRVNEKRKVFIRDRSPLQLERQTVALYKNTRVYRY